MVLKSKSSKRRIVIALLIGLIAGGMCYAQLIGRRSVAGDFTVSWLAARALIAGENPYLVIRPVGDYPYDAPFYYPLPAALVALPFAGLSLTVMPPALAGGLFFGISSALLGYAVLGNESFRLPLFISSPFFVAAALAQWSPLILAAGLLPAFSWLLACKPNLGVPLFFSRPTWRKLIALVVFGLVSLVFQPDWPLHWRRVFSAPTFHQSPLLITPVGFLLLLAILRWRDPAGRLLLIMSVLPQSMWFSDQLVLWAIPRNRAQVWLLTLLSWLAYGLWRLESGGLTPVTGAIHPGKYIVYLLYFPALVLVLLDKDRLKDWPGLAIRTRVAAWLARWRDSLISLYQEARW